ncbi:major facilitator superfamily MFS-1 [Colletotrichum sp. SAR11_59]|nr:major facilitator superfamily MFS-1 [Colletotrichum sp. SAR11_59]
MQHASYHLAPNFSISPETLYLGCIIDDLSNPDVLNEDEIIETPPQKVTKDVKKGFVASQSKMKKGELGVWAKVLAIEGLRGEISGSVDTSSEVTYRFESIETTFFYADKAYITQALNQSYMKEFMQARGYKPVYLVTGLKVARWSSVSIQEGRQWGIAASASMSQPEVWPVDFGTSLNLCGRSSTATGFEESTDFVIGIRVKKVNYTLWGSITGKPQLAIKKHDKGAVLVDSGSEGNHRVLDAEELLMDEEAAGMVAITDKFESAEDVAMESTDLQWVVSSERV